MHVRRCHVLLIEPRERSTFDLTELMRGGSGVQAKIEWTALAPHLDRALVIDADELALLGRLSPRSWCNVGELRDDDPSAALSRLLDKGLVVTRDSDHMASKADADLRSSHWHGLSAVAHRFSRWRGMDTGVSERHLASVDEVALQEYLGATPQPARADGGDARRLALPEVNATPLDALLLRRVTCRNFDTSYQMPVELFASVLYRVFGARGSASVSGVTILKKNAPSAGGLHPTEAFLLVQRVIGIAPGLYHYRPTEHALQPLNELDPTAAKGLAERFVAMQHYFVPAPVMVVLVSRFARNFWKYRQHAKSYRAVVLDAGHLSQTLYLAATELGLAAFITAAVNEADIEQALGLDPMQEGVLAVCGFGRRGGECAELELDPLAQAWPAG